MVKAKDIKSIKENIIKYKDLLANQTDLIQIFKLESEIKEQQYRLMDVESQLLNIDIGLYKNAQLHKQIFIDKYINGLTGKQLINKYNIPRTSLYKLLSTARTLFEK